MTLLELRHPRYDAVVVGARCAGAATAMLLARGGMRVLVVDRAEAGSDTLSTHALMRPAVLQLSRWGLLESLRASDTPAVRTTTFHYGRERVELAIKPKGDVDALYAPRRTLLDPLLAAAAERAGAELHHGVRLVELGRARGGRLRSVVLQDHAGASCEVPASIVIGADGIRSRIARLAGARLLASARHTSAVVYAYYSGLPMDGGYHWYYAPGLSAGAIPTGGGLLCVFVALPPERYARELTGEGSAGFARALHDAAPELAAALGGARRVSPLLRFPGRLGYVRQALGPGYALVGDAGCFKDPTTAHGISDALRDAELLSRALLSGDSEQALERFARERDALCTRFVEISDAVASFAWDLPAVQELHRALSEAMADELRLLSGLDRERAEAA